MEKTRAVYTISEAAAVRAGQSTHGDVVVDVDPALLSADQREELLRCWGTPRHLTPNAMVYGTLKALPELDASTPPEEAVVLLLDARLALREAQTVKQAKEAAEKEAEREAGIQAILDAGVDAIVERAQRRASTERVYVGQASAFWQELPGYAQELNANDQRLVILRAEYQQRVADENARRKAEALAHAEQIEAKRTAAEERKAAQISAWIKEFGTESQKKRLSVDLLPESEVLDGMRGQAFAPLEAFAPLAKEWARYEKLVPKDFCECDYEKSRDISYETTPATEATEDTFDYLEQIKELMPAATVTIEDHTGTCSTCEQSATRQAFRVEVVVGEFTFSRLYDARAFQA